MKKFRLPLLKILSFLTVLFLSSACLSIKPTTTKSGKNYFETFFVGEDGTQFFIKPFGFTCGESKEDLTLDFTFRFKDVIRDSATLRFSIKSSTIYRSIDSVKIFNDDDTAVSNQIALLFNERNKSGFTSRHSTKFSLNELKSMFDNDKWQVLIYHQMEIRSFKPNRRTVRAINSIRDRVFVIM